MLCVVMLAHNASEVTADAVESASVQLAPEARLILLDNGSGSVHAARLAELPKTFPGTVELLRSDRNLGFAGGMNRLIAAALADRSVDCVLLFNNDALLQPGSLAALLAARGGDVLPTACMMRVSPSDAIDNLGIALYRSGLASNRKRTDERLLGPTGGCMLLSRRLLEDLHSQHGYWFDERFFCYAEDTDLVMRARWLGYATTYVDEAVVRHHGSLSSGGPDNEFVLYHGIRNSIWALAKNAPSLWLLAHLPWIVVAHAGIWLRNLRKGRARTLWRLYRDAVYGLPAMWRERRRIRHSRRLPSRLWWSWVEPSLYERGYLSMALRELFRRRGGRG